jgi:class 3 adenylate cyclase
MKVVLDDTRRLAMRWKSFDQPDELRPFPHGVGAFVNLDSLAVGRAILEPGWRWSTDLKPIVGTEWCQLHHLHILAAGRMAFRMADGAEHELGPDEVIDVPPGHDAWVVGDEPVVLFDIAGNIADFALPTSPTRELATMLMTDIVGSTQMAAELGDAVWKQRLAQHNRTVRSQLERFRGREVDTTGDGFLATFPSAAAALRCALEAADATRQMGIEIRAGVHTGEIEVLASDVRGIAVHATARIMAVAQPSEVLASSIARALAEGAGLRFDDRGTHTLKGIETPMQLFAVARDASP